jgi:hypothetical protein
MKIPAKKALLQKTLSGQKDRNTMIWSSMTAAMY